MEWSSSTSERRLIVEIDGDVHADREEYDAERTAWLESQGYRVLRFWNMQVRTAMEWVLRVIAEELEGRPLGDDEVT